MTQHCQNTQRKNQVDKMKYGQMTGTFSHHETDPTAITTYNKLKHGYDSR